MLIEEFILRIFSTKKLLFELQMQNNNFFIFLSVDMITGFNIATVNHDSRIDWLEVSDIIIIIIIIITTISKFSNLIGHQQA